MKENTLTHLFMEQAALHPKRCALVHSERRVTYAELAENANRLAAYLLQDGGLAPEQLVGIHGMRTVESVTAILGILLAGGAYVPLPVDWPLARSRKVIREAGLRLVLTDGQTFKAQGEVDVFPISELLRKGKESQSKTVDVKEAQLAYVMYTSGSTGTPKAL